MKIFRYIFPVVALSLAFSSCQERNPALFDDISGVYFNNRTLGVLLDTVSVTFVYNEGEMMDVPVKVQLLGRPAGYDREVSITASSSDAVEGTDYILPEKAVLPAEASSFEYVVTLLRTGVLKENEKSLTLTIHPNQNFDLPLTEVVQTSGKVTTLSYRIFFSDRFTAAPDTWEDNLLGKFSQQKFELICKVLNINPAAFNDESVMTLAYQSYIFREMTYYIKSEVDKMNAGLPYDTDIIDKETGEPISFVLDDDGN